jgi:hypothetical protein
MKPLSGDWSSKDTPRSEPTMTLPRSVADVIAHHVTWELESIDRMYLNLYVPGLQSEGGVVYFFREHRGQPFASSALMDPITKRFRAAVDAFVAAEGIPLVTFHPGERKEDIAAAHRARFPHAEGIVFVGRAQEKTRVFRTEKRRNPRTGKTYPWIVRTTAMITHFYFYGVDRDFGPFFLKLGTYFPYTGKLCLNGHEYVKRQLTRVGIPFEALDNGLLTCADPRRAQALCDGLSAARIEALARKWLARLPHPYTPADRKAGYRYDVSILQAEFALTQVLDQPVTGRIFFEEVIRENLDVGRPDQVQLIFGRRVTRRTPGRFRTRILTEGVTPSLHVDYKRSRIKQYHKEGRALRTETTINDARDVGVGKRLQNLPALRAIGFQANRRLLQVERLSHDCAIGEAAFRTASTPQVVDGQRVAALRFTDPRVQTVLGALVVFRLLPEGFRNRELRALVAQLLGVAPDTITPGSLTYQLRRLRLRGLIVRIAGTHRYHVTPIGLRTALFFTRTYTRVLRPGLAQILPRAPAPSSSLRRAFDVLEQAMDAWCADAKLAA